MSKGSKRRPGNQAAYREAFHKVFARYDDGGMLERLLHEYDMKDDAEVERLREALQEQSDE